MSLEATLLLLVLALLAAVLAVLLLRKADADPAMATQLGALRGDLKAELAGSAASLSRELSGFTLEQTKALNDAARAEAEQARREAEAMRTQLEAQRTALAEGIAKVSLALEKGRAAQVDAEVRNAAALAEQLGKDAQATRARLDAMDKGLVAQAADYQTKLFATLAEDAQRNRDALDAKLKEMREGNEKKLAEIQQSVNEQLHAAVEKQMNESFARVVDHIAALQKAMGDVAAVTAQVGDLKRLFSNVKARGGWGEAQVKALLDDLMPNGYEANVKLREDSDDVVEFAIFMPTQGRERVLLPVDAKFPAEDYDRLQQAAAEGNAEGERTARTALVQRLRAEAQKIGTKYICPPRTVEFAVLYLPTEGLYAEAARAPGLLEALHREHKVIVLGPSLLPAMLRTIQLGHVTLVMSEKAEAVQQLLAATRTEMQKMDSVLAKLAKQAGTFGNTIEQARTRTRAVGRKLRDVAALDAAQAEALLELDEARPDEDET
jgi:DNA recombination protein RmuC